MDAKASPKRNTKRSGIGWLIVFMLYPLLFYIAPFVALFFLLYYIGVGWLCLALAILGILFYAYFVFWLLREWKRFKDPNYKPPTSGTSVDFGHGPQWNAGIVGLALYHGLFGGHHD